jgi:DNA-binding HxlR family transcriptional regulator
MDEPKKEYGLWMKDLILFSDLTISEKVILSDILNICKNGECRYFKINQTMADMLRVNVKSITRILNSLENKGLIRRQLTSPYSDSVKTKRVLTPVYANIKKLSINNNSPIKNRNNE